VSFRPGTLTVPSRTRPSVVPRVKLQARMDRITERQVDIFFRFRGDSDGLARIGTPEEKTAMPDAAWFAIIELAQGIAQSKAGLLDARAESALSEMLRQRCADDDTVRKLVALA
jgi:hypothetical protein